MKIFATIFFVVISFNTYSQKSLKNFIKISPTLYASKYETSNAEYQLFLKSITNSNDKQVASIDSLRWIEKETYNQPYVEYYHLHPAYNEYPVVNISHQAALMYCNWLTEKYHQNKKRKYKKVVFRLPNENEWELIHSENYLYGWDLNSERNNKNLVQGNYTIKQEDPLLHITDHADVTAPVKSYWPNKKGFYNVSGNVGEMLIEKGKCKGGSWRNELTKLEVNKPAESYKNANPTLGFRVFMEIIEK